MEITKTNLFDVEKAVVTSKKNNCKSYKKYYLTFKKLNNASRYLTTVYSEVYTPSGCVEANSKYVYMSDTVEYTNEEVWDAQKTIFDLIKMFDGYFDVKNHNEVILY